MPNRRLALILGAAVGMTVFLAPAQALAAGTCSDQPGDLNGDGFVDLVIGAPGEDIDVVVDTGSVTVVFGGPAGLGSSGGLLIAQESLGLVSEDGDRFGTAVVTSDVDGDACTDLVVGAPGEDQGRGQVVVIRGSDTGLLLAEPQLVKQGAAGVPGKAEAGDGFGTSLAMASFDHDPTPIPQLAVGAPLEDVGTAADAGAVTLLTVGTPPPTWTGLELTQGSGGVPGVAESGDHFGNSLAGAHNTLIIGTPGEDIGSLRDAGAVTEVRAVGGTHAYSQLWQGSGVSGTAESGDRFGASAAGSVGPGCAASSDGVAVGAPGEDVGSVTDAGLVAMRLTVGDPWELVTEDSTAVAGEVETNDRFGSALLGHEGGLLVGTPGENVGPVGDAGAVTSLEMTCSVGGSPVLVRGRNFTQETMGVPGWAGAGNRFGAAIGRTASGLGPFVVGAPGEAASAMVGAGAVVLLPVAPVLLPGGSQILGPVTAGSQHLSQSTDGIPGASEPGDRFGAALSR